MPRIITKENALESYQNLIQCITNFQFQQPDNPDGYKAATNYNNWISNKCHLILSEDTYTFPCQAVPGTVSKFVYDYLYQSKQAVINTYYKFDSGNNQYVLNVRKSDIPSGDVEVIIHNTILRRGNVVWVEFGYNIGAEFGGKHPAIIIKNCGKTLIVIPLSSQQPTPSMQKTSVAVPKVYNFPLKARWTNVTRITPISVIRIDFGSDVGSVSNSILKDISNTLVANGIK
jgi:mRNA-degrading endonuclease toxin of MazEF toxin-antitoxin module